MGDAGNHSDATVAARFDSIASIFPDAVALRDNGTILTYRQLERRSNQFARFLKRQGVVTGDRVAMVTGRSAAAIVAILGILKTGGIYVPFDKQEPAARLSRMLAVCTPALVLTSAETTSAPAPSGLAISLDDAILASLELSSDPLSLKGNPGDPASVMHTSGSTGEPKGVVVPHRAILRLVTHQSFAPFGPSETFLHFAPLAFDASSLEIWGALLHGGTLAIIEQDHASLDTIAAAIAEYRVTVAWFTAGLFSLLVDQCLDGLKPLHCIVAGGDVLSATHVARAYAALPDCVIVNGYGPTENTTFTCCYPVPRHGGPFPTLPIGFPISRTQVHILNADFRPVRDGETGQICCAGDGLASGYLNQPQRTAEKFVCVAVDARHAERLYLTGDLGRRRHDGAIEFLGRMDEQVKVRGKRVELGEIENALRQDETVLDAVVTARDVQPDGKRLTAHLVLRSFEGGDDEAAAGVLRRLRVLLPDYMVPPNARVLESLPLGKTGKVDRARLRDVQQLPPAPAAIPAQKDSNLEDQVASVWESVLGQAPVSHAANFFDLGGNSLLLLELHARLRASLAPDLQLLCLFEHTSIRGLARFLERKRSVSQTTSQQERDRLASTPRCRLPMEASR